MDQGVENEVYARSMRLRLEMGIPESQLYHIDTPCTIENQIMMYKNAEFYLARMELRVENTTIIIAQKA